jgi:hypothetical protein
MLTLFSFSLSHLYQVLPTVWEVERLMAASVPVASFCALADKLQRQV